MPLTDIAIRKTKPKGAAYKSSDGGGLFLWIQPNGGKWWRYQYRFAGKQKLLALGVYPDVSLSEARDRHSQARKMLAAGNDPGEAKKEAKRMAVLQRINTFENIAREWHESRKQIWSTGHSYKIIKSLEADIFPKLSQRPIAEITALELLSILRAVEGRGLVDTVHRLKQMCGQIFMYAIATGRAERNPVADLRGALKPLKQKHYAHLAASDLPEYLQKLESYDGNVQTQLALKFLLLTFVRTTELRGAEWTEIDMAKSEWRIPAERMKMKDQHIVPLSSQALAVLEELRPLTGHWRYLFPNQHKPSGYMSENTMLYALYRMGYHSRTTGHGFRSTASTILNEHGFAPDVIERQLAHCERNKVRAAYNHAQYLPERRKMMQWWSDYIDAAATNGESKIIPLKQAKPR